MQSTLQYLACLILGQRPNPSTHHLTPAKKQKRMTVHARAQTQMTLNRVIPKSCLILLHVQLARLTTRKQSNKLYKQKPERNAQSIEIHRESTALYCTAAQNAKHFAYLALYDSWSSPHINERNPNIAWPAAEGEAAERAAYCIQI